MKTDMRHQLARQLFEEKIRKVGQLIKLSATVKSSRVREKAQTTQHPLADSCAKRGGECRK
jgi:hypothetical protein